MPDLIRHPECLESTGFRLEFIPMEIGAGMTILIEGVIYKQTLNRSLHKDRAKELPEIRSSSQ